MSSTSLVALISSCTDHLKWTSAEHCGLLRGWPGLTPWCTQSGINIANGIFFALVPSGAFMLFGFFGVSISDSAPCYCPRWAWWALSAVLKQSARATLFSASPPISVINCHSSAFLTRLVDFPGACLLAYQMNKPLYVCCLRFAVPINLLSA